MLALEIKGLSKTYKTGVQALDNIDLQVAEGDFFALLGPNGAGKSTTIGIISSLVNATAGQVKVFGYDLTTQQTLAKSCIGLVPQEFNFNQFETVLQIVLNQAGYYGVPRNIAKQRAHTYLSQLELWDKRNARARELSGGMKRRLMIARALMHEPRLLILDEPTAGVDIEVRRSMWTFLKDINAMGVTIILTTHYLEEAEMLCRNIAIINKGNIIENTSMRGLLSKLTMETFVLDLNQPAEGLTFNQLDYRVAGASSIEIDIHKQQSLNDVFSELSKQGIMVMSMRNKANRLEELFVRLVSRKTEALRGEVK